MSALAAAKTSNATIKWLAAPTSDAWLEQAIAHPLELLIDHAHCERKAAGAVVQLMFRYLCEPGLAEVLSPLAREELEHFEIVLRELDRKKIDFVPQKPSPYGQKVHRVIRDEEPAKLRDTLLCCAVIEARSCERLSLLSEELEDLGLRELYKDLLAAEARHHRIYVELAREISSAGFEDRLLEICSHESNVISRAQNLPRLHSGAGFIGS